MITENIGAIAIPSIGGSINIPVGEASSIYNLTTSGNPQTQSGNTTIAISGTPVLGSHVELIFNSSIILGANNFTVLGLSLSASQALSAFSIDCYYNGSSWDVFLYQSGAVAQYISGSSILVNTIPLNRLAGMTSAQMLLANASNVPTATDITGDVTVSNAGVMAIGAAKVTNTMLASLASARFKLGDGTNRPQDVQMTGDGTLSNVGVFTLAPGSVKPSNLNFSTGLLSVAQLTVSSAQILALNTTPLTIVAAQGSGIAIVVHRAVMDYTFLTAAYSTNTGLALITDTATNPQGLNQISASASCASAFGYDSSSGYASSQILANKALKLQIQTGNPTAGSGTMVVTVWYTTLTTNE